MIKLENAIKGEVEIKAHCARMGVDTRKKFLPAISFKCVDYGDREFRMVLYGDGNRFDNVRYKNDAKATAQFDLDYTVSFLIPDKKRTMKISNNKAGDLMSALLTYGYKYCEGSNPEDRAWVILGRG